MKKTISIITFLFIFSSLGLFAQWQGAGTEENPFKIFTVDDLNAIREQEDNPLYSALGPFGYNVPYTNIHFELMNNIEDSLTQKLCSKFGGHFHGKGHFISLNFNNSDYYLNNLIGEVIGGTIDSLRLEGNMFNSMGIFGAADVGEIDNLICNVNFTPFVNELNAKLYVFSAGSSADGVIFKNCINYSNINMPAKKYIHCGLFWGFAGNLEGMINYGDFNVETTEESIVEAHVFSEFLSVGTIKNCINYGNVTINGIPHTANVSLFTSVSSGFSFDDNKITNCLNTGNVYAKKVDYLGAFANLNAGWIYNCVNTGRLIGDKIAGGIVGENYEYGLVENCLNAGYIQGDSIAGGIVAVNNGGTVKNNLSLSRTSKYSVFGDSISNSQQQFPDSLMFENNFYDKQLLTQMSSPQGDILENNAAKGLLTTDITGFALQEILGDGWSYAEGRYPIPLGLENDSMALVAATPVYLHFETEDDYNHVDSVTKDFTVGLENSVVWNETYGRVSFDDEYASLLSLGYENLVVNLGDYKKEVYINILDIETSIMEESITKNGIIYPNPASEFINIKLDGISADKLEICDISGKLLLSQTITNNYQQIQIKDLKRGMYFLKIYDKNQNIKTLKFVKN
ncbi:MAG: T9SS type A sorting domain-containing protein [Bacteroidales bacterium]